MQEARQEVEQESQTDVTGASWAPAGPRAPEETGRLGRSGGRRPTWGWNAPTPTPTWSHEGAKADQFSVTCGKRGGFPDRRVGGQSG